MVTAADVLQRYRWTPAQIDEASACGFPAPVGSRHVTREARVNYAPVWSSSRWISWHARVRALLESR
jgi:hypothetical protein